MPTPEEIFMAGFFDTYEDDGVEMPVLEKLAGNLGLLEEEEAVEMPVLDKLASNLGLLEEEEGEGEYEIVEGMDLSSLSPLEKLAFEKWAAKNGVMGWVKEKAGKVKEKVKGGVSTLKGEGVGAAEKKLQAAKSEKPKSLRLFSGRKKAKAVAAAEKGVTEAKGARSGLRKKIGIGAGAAGAGLLTAALAKKLISGRKKKKEEAA